MGCVQQGLGGQPMGGAVLRTATSAGRCAPSRGSRRDSPIPAVPPVAGQSASGTGSGQGSPVSLLPRPAPRCPRGAAAAGPGWKRLPAAAGKRKRRERAALEGVRGRGMRGGGWDVALSLCLVLPTTAPKPACKGLILPPKTLLQALLSAPSLVFHSLFIPFPLSGLSCPGNDNPVSSASHCSGAFPSSPWLLAPTNI